VAAAIAEQLHGYFMAGIPMGVDIFAALPTSEMEIYLHETSSTT